MGALMAFRVGQEVVCVDDAQHGQYMPEGAVFGPGLDGLTRGQIYTVREVFTCDFPDWRGVQIRVNEIVRKTHTTYGLEIPFAAARFRPIVKTDISIFTAMLAPSPKQRVDADA